MKLWAYVVNFPSPQNRSREKRKCYRDKPSPMASQSETCKKGGERPQVTKQSVARQTTPERGRGLDLETVSGGDDDDDGITNFKKQTQEQSLRNEEVYEAPQTNQRVEHHYHKMRESELKLFDIQAKFPEIARAVEEIPRSFGTPKLHGFLLSKRAFHGIKTNEWRGSRKSYVDNFVTRQKRRGRKFSLEALEILRLLELGGGFLTWDTMLKGLTVRLQLEARAQKEALESERNAIVERLRQVGDSVEPSDLEPVDFFTTHRPCKTQITRAWCHKTRPRAPSNDFAWALCTKCNAVISLSQRELPPQVDDSKQRSP
jgi:hypothetical protein